MSDYTLTTNYGLYKPTPNADNDAWGGHLNTNFDTVDGVLGGLTGTAGGPWLQLTGGTVTGDTTFNTALNIGTTALGGHTRFEHYPTMVAGKAALFMNRQGGTAGTDPPQIWSQVAYDHSGGGRLANLQLDTNVTSTPGDVWALFNRSNFSSARGASHVGLYSQQIRTGIGAGPQGVAAWCSVLELRSQTGLPSSQDGILQTLELDIFANGADDLTPQQGRSVISCVIGQNSTGGAPVEVSNGISFYLFGGHTGWYKNMVTAAAQFSAAAFSTLRATQLSGAHAIWLNTGHDIAFDTAGAAVLNSNGTTIASSVPMALPDQTTIGGTLNLTAGLIRAAGTTAISLGNTVGGEVFRINSTASALTSHMEIIYSSGTNTWIIRSAGTSANAAIDNSGGSTYLRCNGGVCFGATGGSTSVNNLQAAGSAGTSPVVLSAVGTGANLDISLTPKGTGGIRVNGPVGFNSNAPLAKPALTGAKGSNAALASVIAALVNYGLVTDSTTA